MNRSPIPQLQIAINKPTNKNVLAENALIPNSFRSYSQSSMASILLHSPTLSTTSRVKCHGLPLPSPRRIHFSSLQILAKSHSLPSFRAFPQIRLIRASSDDFLQVIEKDESLSSSEGEPVKFLIWALLWASLSLGFYAFSGDAKAAAVGAADSIRASGFGVKVANALRASGCPDEAVVFALATLPVIELRGAIPVGYWLQLNPVLLTVLSVLGNMVPVPFIILYLKKVAAFLTAKNKAASGFLEMLFERAKRKAGPVKEFQWLGLMLFVAVPFPGTGAWTGAFVASILDMPFWSAVSANFVGVVLAGLLVNLLVNLGLKYAVITGVILFVTSTFMWSILRGLKKSLSASN